MKELKRGKSLLLNGEAAPSWAGSPSAFLFGWFCWPGWLVPLIKTTRSQAQHFIPRWHSGCEQGCPEAPLQCPTDIILYRSLLKSSSTFGGEESHWKQTLTLGSSRDTCQMKEKLAKPFGVWKTVSHYGLPLCSALTRDCLVLLVTESPRCLLFIIKTIFKWKKKVVKDKQAFTSIPAS